MSMFTIFFAWLNILDLFLKMQAIYIAFYI